MTSPYRPVHRVRFVTATSLFDGHDASINIFRRMLQASGAEVIHLGHDRSAQDIAEAVIEEDAQGVAVTSYQGGHLEFFPYLLDLLREGGHEGAKVFGGGGGTILPSEGRLLEERGVERIYSPDDGRQLGLQGMVDDMLRRADFPTGELNGFELSDLDGAGPDLIGRLISAAENHPEKYAEIFEAISEQAGRSPAPIVGLTGTGGSGKSSLADELLRSLLSDFADLRFAVISVDPSRRRGTGALLGDRIRMNSIPHPRAYMRSLATRQANLALSPSVHTAIDILKAAGYDLVILETSGIGQADTEIVDHADLSLYVMTPEYGAATQLEKIDMLDFADVIAVNKADKVGADDALREVRKQYRRNHQLFNAADDDLPVFLTTASAFGDLGTERVYRAMLQRLAEKQPSLALSRSLPSEHPRRGVVPGNRTRYLGEIVDEVRAYDSWVDQQADAAETWYRLSGVEDLNTGAARQAEEAVDPANRTILERWEATAAEYAADQLAYPVRGKEVRAPLYQETLSHTRLPKVSLPKYRSWGDRLRWVLQENVPGEFPFTAGVFELKRKEEEPTRMFAGEGPPEQTNARFHYLASGMPARRLSTAFDSVTLYGHEPARRPDIYGKVGNSGVSVATLDDAKRLYSGFDLCDPATSVSMTINGPAPMILAYFLNAAIDQQCELHIRREGLEGEVEARLGELHPEGRPIYHGDLPEGHNRLGLMLLGATGDQVLPAEVYERIKADTLRTVRGTVQADILKEDQAQNTCIFSTEFGLRMMGDIQQYFVDHSVQNFYSVSISGYHMAEAGANPISQLAFTLANGFTYIEYYLSRGMDIDQFAPNLSFFFSNGIDAEYAVIGRVARRIWAKALRNKYGAGERSQKLKYHIQTSGRSLHAQEVSFNDIRTTLQALYAIMDNCNSLHTNAFDEAITTPTEESVRRALAIQLIINRELGLTKNENPLQGSFFLEDLTGLVEQAVLAEFEALDSRGGVLGSMERQYQRTKIQEESLYYERMKESGEYPVVGVNTFLSKEGSPFIEPTELVRSTPEDRDRLITDLERFHQHHADRAPSALSALQKVAASPDNVFDQLMETSKVASLQQMTEALFAVGGRYRRNM